VNHTSPGPRRLSVGLTAILIALGVSLWAYPHLPDRVATHWGLSGQADGWSPKAVLVFVIPAIMLLLGVLLSLLPRLDPRGEEFHRPTSVYWIIMNSVLVFVAGLQVVLVGVNLGWPIKIPLLVPIGIGILFLLIGNLMPRMRPNWFMGIRTPWTLSSDRVWRKTHRLGGYCFMMLGVLMVAFGFLSRPDRFLYVIGVVVVLALLPVVYSYFAWRRESEAAPTPPSDRT
jgi:uncharacterized membrane protein